MRSLQRALIYLRPYWLITLGAFASLLLVTAANLLSPQILRLVIDDGIRAGDLQMLGWATVALIGVAVIRGVFSFTQGYWSEKASQSAAYEMRNVLFGKLENLSFSYHDQAQTGQLMTRITSDVEQVRSFISAGLLQVVSAVALLVGSLVALFSMNWQLASIALLTIPAMAVIIVRFMRIVQPLFSQVQKKLGALNTVLQENLVGVRVVQAFAREDYEARRYTVLNDELLSVNVQTIRGLASSFPLIFLISNLGTLAVIWFGGHQVIGGTLSLGELVAFNTYLSLLIMPILMLGMIMAQLSRAGVSAERIFEVLDTQSEVADLPGARALPQTQGRVAFERVWFGYALTKAEREKPQDQSAATNGNGSSPAVRPPSEDGYILKDVSFVAEPGQTVAIMGREVDAVS